ncbi:hypothetical protein [Candidatus Ichthyocystis hellenicum]|uniref:hypothetical protein n=1 Tax=Candidatus Ichthyocystis hellenicum TaxID=1561003 RepID=UPI000B82CCD1|nr:hypothetical protein [Candidatus Ichthyocystis hellenicum]
MSRVQENCLCVNGSCSLLEGCGRDGVLCNEDSRTLNALPSCSNNENGGQSLVSNCNELSGIEGVDGTDSDLCGSEYGRIIPALKEGVRKIESTLVAPVGNDYAEDVRRIGIAIGILEELVLGVEVVVVSYVENFSAESMPEFPINMTVDLLKAGLNLVKGAVADYCGGNYRLVGLGEKETCERDFVAGIARIEKGVHLVEKITGITQIVKRLSSRRGHVVGSDEKESASARDLTPSSEEIIKSVVGSCGGNVKFSSLLRSLIKEVLPKFTNYREGVAAYTDDLIGIDGDFERREEVVNIILRVAENVVVGVEEGCDFLLKSSASVRGYFASVLGIDGSEVTRTLLDDEVPGGALRFSEEELNRNESELVVHLSKELSCLVEPVSSLNVSCHDKYDNTLFRSNANLISVVKFLRKIIASLVFFPESLHPGLVWVGIDKICFDRRFTAAKGRCCQKYRVGGAFSDSGFALSDRFYLWGLCFIAVIIGFLICCSNISDQKDDALNV